MLPVLVLVAVSGVLAQNVRGHSFSQISVTYSPERLQQVFAARVDKQALTRQLQNLPLQESLRNNMKQGGGTGGILGIGNIFGGMVNTVVGGVLGLHIKKVEVLTLALRVDETTKSLLLTFPFALDIQLKVPLTMYNLINIKVFMDTQIAVVVQKNPRSGRLSLVLGNCQNNPGHLRVRLLDSNQGLVGFVNEVLQLVTGVFEKTIPFILQQQICPVVRVGAQLMLDLFMNPPSYGQSMQQISANSFDITSGGLRIDYEAKLTVTGQGSYVVPSNPKPLPSVPLGDSFMNIIMSEELISTVIASALPAGTISIDSKVQVAEFQRHLEAARGFSMPAGGSIQALQISYGPSKARLASGKIVVELEFNIKIIGNHARGTHQVFASIKGIIHSTATANVNSGNLVFSCTLQRIRELSLEESSVGNIGGRHVYDAVFNVLNASMMPYANKLLSKGYTLPIAGGSETEEMQVTLVEDSLVVSAGGQQVQQVQQEQNQVEWVTWYEV